MINRIYLIRTSILAAIAILVLQFYSCETLPVTDKPEEEVELAELMFHNQRYMEKLYFAGKNQNWELAKFYVHELDENMEKLANGKIIEDEVNVSNLAKTMFVPVLEDLDKSILARDTVAFLKGYNLTVNTCNSCHTASGFNFIKIKIPVQPAYSNQEY
jgi:hypothetical protein